MAVPLVAKIIISLIVSAAIGNILQKNRRRDDDPLDDESPATFASRNDPIQMVVGRRLVGPVFGWTGNRTSENEAQPGAGGKGISQGSAGENKVWYEQGWQMLAIGPCQRILRIVQDGELLYDNGGAGITHNTHPSGTEITIDADNIFRIYWGETDQPIDTDLSSAIGVSSGWPFVCYIFWVRKRLGGFPTWPKLDFELECRPYNPGAVMGVTYDSLTPQLGDIGTAGDPWLTDGTIVDDANCEPIRNILPATPYGEVEICGDHVADFVVGDQAVVANNSTAGDRVYTVTSSTLLPGGTSYGYDAEDSRPSETEASWAYFNQVNEVTNQTHLPLPTGVTLDGSTLYLSFDRNLAVSSAGVIIEPTGVAGGNTLGVSKNSLWAYLWVPRSTENSFKVNFGVRTAVTTLHGATFEFDPSNNANLVSAVSANGGADVAATLSADFPGGKWYLIQTSYTAGDGGSPSGAADAYDVRLAVFDNIGSAYGTVEAIVKLEGDGSGSTAEPLVRNPEAIVCSPATRVGLDSSLFGLPEQGDLCPLVRGGDGAAEGANGAHVIWQFMTESYPHGAALPSDCFNVPSLQAVGLLIGEGQESLKHSVHVRNYEPANVRLKDLFDDIGLFIGMDTTSADGEFVFTAARSGAPVGTIGSDMLLPDPLVIDRVLEPKAPSSIIYEFTNEQLNYRSDTWSGDDDGRGRLGNFKADQTLSISTSVDYETVSKIGRRREPEELNPPAAYLIFANHDALSLRPGDVVRPVQSDAIGTVDFNLRVVAVRMNTESSKVEIVAVTDTIYSSDLDNYGIEISVSGPSISQETTPVLVPQDVQQAVVEAPAQVAASQIGLMPLRVRADQAVTNASVLFSDDDVTYEFSGGISEVPGGTLVGDWSATYEEDDPDASLTSEFHRWQVEYGPVFRAPNNDVLRVPTLDYTNWSLGRTWAVINDEIMYVRSIEALGNSNYRLRGVIRARFDTTFENHSDGDAIFLFDGVNYGQLYDPIAAPGEPLYTKMLEVRAGRATAAAMKTPVTTIVTGRGIRPIRLSSFRTANMTQSFVSGEDVEMKWEWSDPEGYFGRTGAGHQRYGEPVQAGELQGKFTLIILDAPGGNVVRTVTDLSEPTYTYANVDLVADLGGEASFAVQVVLIGPNAELGDRLLGEVAFV